MINTRMNRDILRKIIDKCNIKNIYTLAQTNKYILINIRYMIGNDNFVLNYKHDILNWSSQLTFKMKMACEYNYIDIIDYLIELGYEHIYNVLQDAIRYNNKYLIDFFIKKDIKNIDILMNIAINYNNIELINLLIEKGANDWHCAISSAKICCNQYLIDFFQKKIDEEKIE